MERKNDIRLQQLRESGVPIYSISRLDCINRCLAEAYQTYRLNKRGKDNIYSALGSKVHDVLEGIVNGDNTEADLLPAVQEELDDVEMLGLEFPKMPDGSDGIRDKWVKDMEHFCTTYKSPVSDKLTTEELFIYTSPKGHVLQGYIDLQKRNSDGSISIYDYKTSSLYTGAAVKEHSRQLTTYLLGLEQAGEKVKSVAWIFLKYVEITFMGKKTTKSKEKTSISKVVERCKIGYDMSKYVEQEMYELGYDEIDIEIALNNFRKTNMFSDLPDDVAKLFTVKPYICTFEVTDEVRRECEEYIDNTIEMWESLGEDIKNYPPKSFTKIQKNGKEVSDCFYCGQLCSHSNECSYYRDYLDKMDNGSKDEFDDLF